MSNHTSSCKNPDCRKNPIKCYLCNIVGISTDESGYSCLSKSKDQCDSVGCVLYNECIRYKTWNQ